MSIYSNIPYTYLIGWSNHNKFYYGARWAKNCLPEDLWVTYFTSSKHVKLFREQHGEPDIIQVRKIFNDVHECKIYENKILQKLNVLLDDKWLNKNINGLFLPLGKQSSEHINKRIQKSIQTKIKRGTFNNVSWTKESNPEAAEKVSKALSGKKKSQKHIKSMRNRPQDTLTLTCPYCNKSGDYKNMKRWHFDRCKNNPQRLQDLDKMCTCDICGHIAKESPNFYRNHNTHCKSRP